MFQLNPLFIKWSSKNVLTRFSFINNTYLLVFKFFSKESYVCGSCWRFKRNIGETAIQEFDWSEQNQQSMTKSRTYDKCVCQKHILPSFCLLLTMRQINNKLIVDVIQTAIKFHNNKIISINVPTFGKEFKKDLVLQTKVRVQTFSVSLYLHAC